MGALPASGAPYRSAGKRLGPKSWGAVGGSPSAPPAVVGVALTSPDALDPGVDWTPDVRYATEGDWIRLTRRHRVSTVRRGGGGHLPVSRGGAGQAGDRSAPSYESQSRSGCATFKVPQEAER